MNLCILHFLNISVNNGAVAHTKHIYITCIIKCFDHQSQMQI